MTAEELFQKHSAHRLAQYNGSLHGLIEALRSGNIPGENEHRIPQLTKELKNHLQKIEEAEQDSFLLRYALIVPGLLRGIIPPITCVFPEHGGLYGDRLEDAAGQVQRLREALDLAHHTNPALSNDTETALITIWELTTAPFIDEDWVQSHVQLGESDMAALTSRAVACLDHPSEEIKRIGTNILGALADFRDEGLGSITSQLLQRNVYWLPSMFRDAPDSVASVLISFLETGYGWPGELLLPLAWTRGAVAHAAFSEWRVNPPAWATGRFAKTEEFLQNAGWSLDEDGRRRDLISVQCYRLSVDSKSAGAVKVQCRVSQGNQCSHCGAPLVWLFDFSGVSVDFFSGVRLNAPRRVLCCLQCACFGGPFYSEYYPDGDAKIHPATSKSDFKFGGEERQACTLYLQSNPWPPFAATQPFGLTNASSLGGIPTWLQSADYPNCPDCKKSMRFLAQFDCSSQAYEEGIYYVFFCEGCRIAAVNHQQT